MIDEHCLLLLNLLPAKCGVFPGPYQVNGVPLRRVNQAYVIATSMKVDLSKVTIPVADDSYFTRVSAAKKTEEDQFFEQGSKVRPCQPDSVAQERFMLPVAFKLRFFMRSAVFHTQKKREFFSLR